MGDNSPQARAIYFRGVAQSLREIANRVRFDWKRKNQILALADGFERFADRLAQMSPGDADKMTSN